MEPFPVGDKSSVAYLEVLPVSVKSPDAYLEALRNIVEQLQKGRELLPNMPEMKQKGILLYLGGMLRLLTLLLLLPCVGFGQNLVPNPSFEDTVSCPFWAGDIEKASGWIRCGSSDYFHSCNLSDWGVPNNVFGYQPATSGIAYAGFLTYANNLGNDREFVACSISTPLTIGTKYYVSFNVALSLNDLGAQSNCASDKIGAMFTTYFYNCDTLLTTPFITNNPPVFTDAIITDSLNWTQITGSFVADSVYTYLVIGNFFDDANTDTIKFFNDFMDHAYYYLDDVCLSTDSAYCAAFVGVEEKPIEHILKIYPNPTTGQFTVQGATGTIEVHDLFGRLVLTTTGPQVDMSPYPSGIYFVRVGETVRKLVKQ